jgi:membrane protease YdiL (CAAX protease family)
VLGQAIQLWAPQPFLPAFDAFQGSNLPYGLLLSTQLVLIALMAGVASRVWWGALRKSARSARVLGCIGGIYLLGSLGRIGLGLTLSQPSPWFTAWIPAIFHVVLAAFALTLAAYHADPDEEVTP